MGRKRIYSTRAGRVEGKIRGFGNDEGWRGRGTRAGWLAGWLD